MINHPESSGSGQTRVGLVVETIRRRIATRALVPGARLPSIRAMAETLRVSKSTVVDAYDRLAAEGAIVARRGSGFYVAGHTPPLVLAEIGPRREREIDSLWVMRQSLETDSAVLKPGCGWLPLSFMPDTTIRQALRRLARGESSDLIDYSPPRGSAGLRALLARRLAERGIQASQEQILLTDSGTHAIDLLCRFFLQPDDAVLIDDPGYFNFHAILKVHRANVVGVPYTPSGPDLEAFAAAAARHSPRLYITNAALHNPTGASLSATTAHRLMKLVDEHDLIVIEDDIFADFESDPAPRLSAFDGLQRVISIGSFSKTLSAAIRCGYIAARNDWIDGLTDLKLATSFGSGRFAAEFVHELLVNGGYRRHMQSLRTKLAAAMGETIRRLDRLGIKPWIEPRGGMFLWARLPDGYDSADIARQALSRGVVFAPGNVFSLTSSAGSFFRFNVAQCADPRIYEMLRSVLSAKAAPQTSS